MGLSPSLPLVWRDLQPTALPTAKTPMDFPGLPKQAATQLGSLQASGVHDLPWSWWVRVFFLKSR